MVWGLSPPGGFPRLCENVWHQRAEIFRLLHVILTYGSLFAVAVIDISSTMLPQQRFY